MDDYEFLLADRLDAIRKIVAKHGQDKFYVAFSGGKDSTVLHHLIDMALPGNDIPRVYCDTGLDYSEVRRFVFSFLGDSRFKVIHPDIALNMVFSYYGYPFKSKEHSTKLHEWQLGHTETSSSRRYTDFGKPFSCPKCLAYQFKEGLSFKVSQYCCIKMKKRPFHLYESSSGRSIGITGMRRSEGGLRTHLGCLVTDKRGNVSRFHPMSVCGDGFVEWFVEKYGVMLCLLYYPPFCFKRTGCKGCPFALDLQRQLDLLEEYLPQERKQCEAIWKPVYDEYRRIGYRLRKDG